MANIDLHIHSTASDGTDTPAQIAAKAAEIGLSAIALTDHDTLSGLEECEAEARAHGIEFIRGCEISTTAGEYRFHMLGLWLPKDCVALENELEKLRTGRSQRNEKIIELLNKAGIKISMENVLQKAGGESVGRPHIAAAMLEKGYIKNEREAFKEWLGRGCKAYVPKPVMEAEQAVMFLTAIGATPVLAHPLLEPAPPLAWLDAFIARLAQLGLSGLEAYHSEHSQAKTATVLELARKYNLAVSGGSDYHGANKKDVHLGNGYGNLSIGHDILQKLKATRKKASLSA